MSETIWLIVWDFVKEYAVLIGIVVLTAIYLLVKNIKDKKALKKNAERVKIMDDRRIKPPTKPEGFKADWRPEPEEQEDLKDLFSDKKPKKIVEKYTGEVMDKIEELGEDLDRTSEELDMKLREEFERLREELRIAVEKKKATKEHGLKVAELYDKYVEREKNIILMMDNIEKNIPKTRKKRN